MKKIFLLGFICMLAFCAAKVYELPSTKSDVLSEITSVSENDILSAEQRSAIEAKQAEKAESFRHAADWIAMNRGAVGTGIVDPVVHAQVRQEVEQQRLLKQGNTLSWEERGPNNIGGRTRALMFDKDNPQKMIVGGVAGGLWMSENGGGLWSPIEDSFEKGCIAVASITQTASGHIYVGTGEGFTGIGGTGQGGVYGSGVFKSVDGGVTWNLCNGTAPPTDPANTSSTWTTVDKLAAHKTNGDIVYAANSGGIFVTLNGGASWQRVKDTNGNEISNGRGYDVVTASDGKVHFTTPGRYYRSVGDDTFERIENANEPTDGGRKCLAVQESDPNLMYAVSAGGFCINTVKRSTDGGSSWQTIANGSIAFHPGGSSMDQCQANYDLTICAHPTNPDIVYVGAVLLWRGIRYGDGWEWQQIDSVFDDATSINYVHSDKHEILFKPGTADEMYVTSDGGLSRTQNASDDVPIFEERNKNYNVTQFYSISADLDGKIMGGTQDNGSLFMNCSTNSALTATSIRGGDGGFSEISNINSNALFTSVQFGLVLRSGNGGEGFSGSFFDCNIDCAENGADEAPAPASGGNCAGDGKPDGGGLFVTPFYLWEDAELYHKVKGIKLEENQVVSDPLEHRGQTFRVTRNEDLIPDNEAELYSDMKATLAEDVIWIGWDEEANAPKDYGFGDYRYTRSRFYLGDVAGQLWMTQDALNFQTTPFWTRIGDAAGRIRSITTSADGNTVWAGTTNGRIMRVNNLDEIDINAIKLDDGDECDEIAEFTDFASEFIAASGRSITGISVHPFNPDKVYFCAGNYGSTNFVWEISNASDSDIDEVEVENITGNLPGMPVYDIVVSNPQSKLVIATEYGAWLGDLNQPVSSMWTEENGGDMAAVPAFRIREESMARVNPGDNSFCRVIYLGTHGRGSFRTTSLTNGSCGQDVIGACNIVFSGLEEIEESELNLYPNPASSFVNLGFNISEDQELEVSVYSLGGKLVSRVNRYEAFAGNNNVEINVGDIPNGNYLVVLRAGDYQASTQLSVKH